ncbi:MAG TPA: hypothetical protein VHO91_23815 [Rhodopila sp.]|nr:hypothetical protein [Rhodopila sp.]
MLSSVPLSKRIAHRLMNIVREMLVRWDLLTFRIASPTQPVITCLRCLPDGPQLSRLAILVIYAAALDANHHRAIKALSAAGYRIALINNRRFDDAHAIPADVALILENHNVGRDIGAYIRAIRQISTLYGLTADARVLFLNDSVIFLPGVEAVFQAFAQVGDEWTGVTESRNGGYHVASWGFQVSAAVLRSDAFRQWAAAFNLTTNRAYLIRNGEIGLTKALLSAGYRPRVLFGIDFLSSLFERIQQFDNASARIVPCYMNPGDLADGIHEELLDRINHTHLMTFPGVVSKAFPFIKKDLYYRHVFSREQIEALCREVARLHGQDLAAECHDILLSRIDGATLRGWTGLCWRLGII